MCATCLPGFGCMEKFILHWLLNVLPGFPEMIILYQMLTMLPGVEYAAWCLIQGDANVTSGVGSVEILHWVLNMLPGV